MKMTDHLIALDGQDYAPRVIERRLVNGQTGFYGWTPCWEGPIRPDYMAAMADLRDRLALYPNEKG